MNKKEMYKGVLFDLDGVLINSREMNIKAMNDALHYFHKSLLKKKEYETINKIPLRKTLHHYFSKNFKKANNYFMRIQNRYYDAVHPILHARYLLRYLKSRGFKLGLVTNRDGSTRRILKRLMLKQYFSVIVTAKSVKHPKPSPEPIIKALKSLKLKNKDVIFVGDMDSDIKAAKRAGVKSILFSTTNKKMRPKPDLRIDDLTKIINILKH